MLTEAKCRSAKPAAKAYKLTDEKGLHLFVSPTGYKSWRLKYHFQKKEKRIVFGPYPEIGLKEARDLREEARRSIRLGIDPGAAPSRSPTATPTFREIAQRSHDRRAEQWTPRHAKLVWASMEKEVLPALGAMAIDTIRPSDVRKLLDAIQDRSAVDLAHRTRGRISSVFEMAMVMELVELDPAASMGAILRTARKGRMPAIEKLPRLREMLTALEDAPAQPTTKLASRLLALTAARPGMIRFAEKADFEGLDTDEPIWRVPAERMKQELEMKEDAAFEFVLPLAPAAVDLVETAMSLSRASPLLFPSSRFSHRPQSENSLSSFYRRQPIAAGRHVPHGWRASFSTIMNERAALTYSRPADVAFEKMVIDMMLAHRQQGVESRYNRALYMPKRRELAIIWAELLLEGFPTARSLLNGARH